MSKVIFAWDLPADAGDLYVKCESAARARVKPPATESEGVNFNDATIKTQGGEVVGAGNLYAKWPGNEDDLTNPFRFAQNAKGYWKAYPIDGQPILHVGAPPPPKENTWTGGGKGKGGGGKTMTRDQLDEAIAYSISATIETANDLAAHVPGANCTDRYFTEIFAKILGCAMFVDWPVSPGGQVPEGSLEADPTPVDEDDIPF